MAWLLALNGDLLGKWYPLDAATLVGRASLNHVVLDDPRISRQHAKIAPEEGGYVVYDLNSANGTFVDDQPVKRQRLEHGATVRFGPYTFAFKINRERAPTVPSAGNGQLFGGHVEVRTLSGMAAPVKIIESLDVSSGDEVTNLVVLEDAYRKLSKLHEFLRSASATLDTAELIDRIIANLLQTFSAREVEFWFYEDRTGSLRPVRCQQLNGGPIAPRPLSPEIFEEVVHRGRAVLSAPFSEDDGGGNAMHAPLMSGEQVLGAIGVREPINGEPFVQRDLDLLAGLAAVASLALHNARMHADLLRQQRLEQDLELARQIQISFLPRALPTAPQVELHAEYEPVFSIGGDFYDVIQIDERRLGLFIGDVAGKGVAAALLMARVSSDLRLAVRGASGPGQVIARVNSTMLEREQPEVFVTGVFLVLDTETGRVILANAGHCPPIVRRRDGSCERIDAPATAMGFFATTTFVETEVKLEGGDSLVLYTDGIVDALSSSGEEFGEDRLERSLSAKAIGASGLAASVLDDLRGHMLDAQQVDDMTLVVCRYLQPPIDKM